MSDGLRPTTPAERMEARAWEKAYRDEREAEAAGATADELVTALSRERSDARVRRAERDVLRLAVQWRILTAQTADPTTDPVAARWAAEAADKLRAAVTAYEAAREPALQDAERQGEQDGREEQDQADAGA